MTTPTPITAPDVWAVPTEAQTTLADVEAFAAHRRPGMIALETVLVDGGRQHRLHMTVEQAAEVHAQLGHAISMLRGQQ